MEQSAATKSAAYAKAGRGFKFVVRKYGRWICPVISHLTKIAIFIRRRVVFDLRVLFA